MFSCFLFFFPMKMDRVIHQSVFFCFLFEPSTPTTNALPHTSMYLLTGVGEREPERARSINYSTAPRGNQTYVFARPQGNTHDSYKKIEKDILTYINISNTLSYRVNMCSRIRNTPRTHIDLYRSPSVKTFSRSMLRVFCFCF